MGGELKPCPFCGGDAFFLEGADDDGPFVAVGCNCGVGTGKHYHLMDDASPNAAEAWNRRAAPLPGPAWGFQNRVREWAIACVGEDSLFDATERNYRFFEEASELVQAGGLTRQEAHAILDWVFDKPAGAVRGEVGDVMISLAVLATAHAVDIGTAGEVKLIECLEKIDATRAKQESKPRFSALTPAPSYAEGVEAALRQCQEFAESANEWFARASNGEKQVNSPEAMHERANYVCAVLDAAIAGKPPAEDGPADFGGTAVQIVEAILLNLGIGAESSREPGADRRRDRLCRLIEPMLPKGVAR